MKPFTPPYANAGLADNVASPRIAVVMGAYNGATYIAEQLETILSQTVPPALLLVSDDGSTDETRDIVRAFGDPVRLIEGPGRGYAANFMHLLQTVPDDIDYVALSDQDDYWLPFKLARALDHFEGTDAGTPTLYGSQSLICDANLVTSRPMRQPDAQRLGFHHALTQNFAGGNTFVLNRDAVDLAQTYSPPQVLVHDWWLYLLVTATGGKIIHDPEATLLYRQHGNNLIGANFQMRSHLRRFFDMYAGVYRRWNDANLAGLARISPALTSEAQALVQKVSAARAGGMGARLSIAREHGLYRQGFLGQAGLYASLLLARF